jgi:hypothetical protein
MTQQEDSRQQKTREGQMSRTPRKKGLPPSKAASLPKPKKPSQLKKPPKNKGLEQSTATPISSPGEIAPSPLRLLFPDGIETLLDVDGRKALPQFPQHKPGRKNKLYELIQFAPDLYAKMIQHLAAGISPNVAAECCGIAERTFHEWGEKGAQDANNVTPVQQADGTIIYEDDPIDSYYSRFFYDVRRAIATKAAQCEAKLAEVDPIKWLSRGSGRIFGGKWGKNPDKPTQQTVLRGQGQQALPAPEDDAIEGTFTVRPQLQGSSNAESPNQPHAQDSENDVPAQGQAPNHSVLHITPEQEYEVLKVWDSIEQIKLSDAIKQAYEDQASTNDDDIDNEVDGDDE